MLLFGVYLQYSFTHEDGLIGDYQLNSNSLRRCISTAHRDARYVKQGMCIYSSQRLHALQDLVYSVKVMLENADVIYWIDSGTLLGVYRARQLVPWDYNADFGITMTGLEYLRTTNKEQLEVPDGYELTVFNSSLYEVGDTSPAIPVRFVDMKFGLYANIFAFKEFKGLFKDNIKPAAALEIEDDTVGDGAIIENLMGPDPSGIWQRCAHCQYVDEDEDNVETKASNALMLKHFKVPRDWIFPLRTCKLELFEVMCPAQIAPYLMIIFGNRFLTPELWE
ncbi:hypothetical protein CCR75_003890 [Bremia lactucae]|uniref:LicD/FKTN/FKRP nucleotidyltransferase domain-containing protein n=1 Tax=Bremia lactucae TaxID=4779 RepID=A0A976II31_BRELC|nr:hypothetical protein CCR75_003890 [Bremia lactucae]